MNATKLDIILTGLFFVLFLIVVFIYGLYLGLVGTLILTPLAILCLFLSIKSVREQIEDLNKKRAHE